MTTALITGGTAGLGAAFARHLAAEGHDLVLVARDLSRLERVAAMLSERHAVRVRPLAADLSTDEGCEAAAEAAAEVDVLVNNAGISLGKGFPSAGLEGEERLLDLNVRAVLRLTHAAFPEMARRGGGTIVNVSSVAGFGATMPGSTYNATKAWVTSFSESIGLSGRGQGVRVMALCPGFVRTEFHASAEIPTDDIPQWMWLDADAVVEAGMRDLRLGKLISVPSVRYKLIVSAIRHMPLGMLGRITSRMAAISARGQIR
ncbi:hypothetical protein LX16_2339 [Stackebrandtia albiflava]|uniref:Short-subunit dehydrogenase n=1 Tax=Stackebrandtia albiflava TaxID=406432 RepID=A0A562V1B1_9ACTN|nr:SDR family oxidoreductase [Stackebrandtia albiflava]TWJ11613.1 hypothetical protein LX16_2339 [Stackebrandtia albiflava]